MTDTAPAPTATPVATAAPSPTIEPTTTPEVTPAAPAPTATAEPVTTEPADWRATITDPKVKEFAAKFTSPADAASAALQMRQKLSTAINLPGKDASPEDIADFNKKLGVPDSADGYEITPPEDLIPPEMLDQHKAGMAGYTKVFHEAGVSGAAAKKIMEHFYNDLRAANQARVKSDQEALEQGEAALAREWGSDFQANVQYADRAYKQFGGDSFKRLVETATFEGKPIGSHPVMLKVFAEIGRRTGEAGMQLALTDQEVGSIDSQIDELSAKIFEATQRGDNSERNRLISQRSVLVQRRHPEAA